MEQVAATGTAVPRPVPPPLAVPGGVAGRHVGRGGAPESGPRGLRAALVRHPVPRGDGRHVRLRVDVQGQLLSLRHFRAHRRPAAGAEEESDEGRGRGRR